MAQNFKIKLHRNSNYTGYTSSTDAKVKLNNELTNLEDGEPAMIGFTENNQHKVLLGAKLGGEPYIFDKSYILKNTTATMEPGDKEIYSAQYELRDANHPDIKDANSVAIKIPAPKTESGEALVDIATVRQEIEKTIGSLNSTVTGTAPNTKLEVVVSEASGKLSALTINDASLKAQLDNKSNDGHTHTMTEVTGLNGALKGTVASRDGAGYFVREVSLSTSGLTGTTSALTKAEVTAALGYEPAKTDTTYSAATQNSLGLIKGSAGVTINVSGEITAVDGGTYE